MSTITFSDWQAQQKQDLEFLAECQRLELGYQIARMGMLRGIIQAELADKVRWGHGNLRLPASKMGAVCPAFPFWNELQKPWMPRWKSK